MQQPALEVPTPNFEMTAAQLQENQPWTGGTVDQDPPSRWNRRQRDHDGWDGNRWMKWRGTWYFYCSCVNCWVEQPALRTSNWGNEGWGQGWEDWSNEGWGQGWKEDQCGADGGWGQGWDW